MQEITEKHGISSNLKIENNDYKLIGLPLYNQKNILGFKAKVKEYLATEIVQVHYLILCDKSRTSHLSQ